jgi:hypothetical protein
MEVMNWMKHKENLNVDAVFILLKRFSTLNVLHQSGALINANSVEIEHLLNQGMATKNNWQNITFQGLFIMTKAMDLFYSVSMFNGKIIVIF